MQHLLVAGITLLSLSLPAQKNKGPKLSQASLDLDTCGCPTTFGPPTCEKRTDWRLVKTLKSASSLTDPVMEPFQFEVRVIEGKTRKFVVGNGQIVVTNSGDLSAVLSSVVLSLEQSVSRNGDALGPSGRNWKVLRVALQNEAAACGNTARTVYGDATATPGSKLVLYDSGPNDVIALNGVLPIPATKDNDGDGLRDEDAPAPCGVDNDNDGRVDEDPPNGIDDDNDGKIDEDGPDDDGDGKVDEDSACQDAVRINFRYCFDVTDICHLIEAPATDPLRLNMMVTFGSAGRRGGSGASGTVDVNCNNIIDVDDPSTPLIDESEKDNIRTIQQRSQFAPLVCKPVCQKVALKDPGAVSNDPTCVRVDETDTLDECINATGVEGTTTTRLVNGKVSCIGSDCSTSVTNTATLTCDNNDAISGSPASASFDVTCSSTTPDIETGDFCTQTQGGWGGPPQTPHGKILDDNFAKMFPSGLIVGDPDGPDADSRFAILLTSSTAVRNYLPAGGTAAALTADQTNPNVTSAGVFGGQLVAATINVAVDDCGLRTTAFPAGTLGTLVYKTGCVVPALVGKSVNQVIALANTAISGGGLPAGVSFSDLNDALTVLNENFVDCVTNKGCLELP